MKVILLEDIKGVGKKGQIYEAAEGYARNFLLPRKLAAEATKGKLNELAHAQKAADSKKLQEIENSKELAKTLEENVITISMKTGENGKLFGSVTNKEISAALQSQVGIEIDRKKIIMKDALKSTGTHTVEIKLPGNITAALKVDIVEQK